MSEIYIVTSGSNSDYSIDRVFTDKEKAEEFVEFVNTHTSRYDQCGIETWQTDEPFSVPPKGLKRFYVFMHKNGNGARAQTNPADKTRQDGVFKYGKQECICAVVEARDEKHAIKILNERRTMLIATEQWKVGE